LQQILLALHILPREDLKIDFASANILIEECIIIFRKRLYQTHLHPLVISLQKRFKEMLLDCSVFGISMKADFHTNSHQIKHFESLQVQVVQVYLEKCQPLGFAEGLILFPLLDKFENFKG
jgi:hypothetical protein